VQPVFYPVCLSELTGWDYMEYEPAFVTADRKLFKVPLSNHQFIYYLPETWSSVRFDTIEVAYHAAYGKDLDAA